MTTARVVRDRAQSVLERAQRDPVWFASDVLGRFLWSRQREILEAIRDEQQVAVRSCHGVGKTYTAAVAVLWFLLSFPRSRVVTTATTWKQVEKLLWHEIRQLHGGARFPLGGTLLATELRLGDGRFAIGLSAKPEEAESFAGHHAPKLLQVFDEASGVHPLIYEAAEGHMTSAGAKRLLIGNPTRTSGEFYDAFHKARSSYHRIHIAARHAPAFTGEQVPPDVADALISCGWVSDKFKKWGKGSPLYEVRVDGNFPSGTDDTVIPLALVEDAQLRTLFDGHVPAGERGVVTCDVARFGSDDTVIASRVNQRVRIRRVRHGQDTVATTNDLVEVAHRVGEESNSLPRFVIDDDGIGGAVTDQLRAKGLDVTPFNAAGQAFRPDKYPNRRSEIWFAMRDALPELDIDDEDSEHGEELSADLVAPVYKLDGQGRRVVEAKELTKKRLGRSPDKADAVLLTLVPEAAGVVVDPVAEGRRRRSARDASDIPDDLLPDSDLNFLEQTF